MFKVIFSLLLLVASVFGQQVVACQDGLSAILSRARIRFSEEELLNKPQPVLHIGEYSGHVFKDSRITINGKAATVADLKDLRYPVSATIHMLVLNGKCGRPRYPGTFTSVAVRTLKSKK
jgi:hypothetical protein